MKTEAFISAIDDGALIEAIKAVESKTSGELRVFVSSKNVEDPTREAWIAFKRLKMDRTAQRNGVLVFVAPVTRKFAIIGDQEIHRHCDEAFWLKLASHLSDGFKAGDYTGALVQVIQEAGLALARHFPGRHDDVNELPDDVVRD